MSTLETILSHFSAERQQFVQAVLDSAPRARTWCTLDFEALAQRYPADHSRVVTALDYLAEKGWIELEAKQMTEVYAVLQVPPDAAALSHELAAYFQAKEVSEIARIHAVLDFFSGDTCMSQRLAAYFGDAQAPLHCGHCSACFASSQHDDVK